MSEKIIEKELASEMMLYDSIKDEIHILNDTARWMYKLYKEGKNNIEIEQAIRQSFTIDTSIDLTSDVKRCIDEFEKKDLL